MEIETLVETRHKCSEGPHWDADNNRVLFIDIFGKTCTTVDLETKKVCLHPRNLGQPLFRPILKALYEWRPKKGRALESSALILFFKTVSNTLT